MTDEARVPSYTREIHNATETRKPRLCKVEVEEGYMGAREQGREPGLAGEGREEEIHTPTKSISSRPSLYLTPALPK